jgi:hypothetical protein
MSTATLSFDRDHVGRQYCRKPPLEALLGHAPSRGLIEIDKAGTLCHLKALRRGYSRPMTIRWAPQR